MSPVSALVRARSTAADLRITPTNAILGAEVAGVDLRAPFDADLAEALRAALLDHKVLFFRDQDLSYEQHVAFARLFGPLEGHPVTGHVPGYPEVLVIRNGEYDHLNETTIGFIRPINKWHADVTFRPEPAFGAVLRARTLPPRGGDTLFADMTAVYEDILFFLRDRLDRLTATHDILKSYGWKLSDAERAELNAEHPPVSHPVVRVIPETGARALFVNHGFTTKIDGLDPAESDQILAQLYDRVKAPAYQVRFTWTPNAVVVWDNRVTQHYPVADYWPADRQVERVTIRGDRPRGV